MFHRVSERGVPVSFSFLQAFGVAVWCFKHKQKRDAEGATPDA
jgi:hypothetical protein